MVPKFRSSDSKCRSKKYFLDTSQSNKIYLHITSDVLPWQCHTRYGSDLANTCFVDVDYPDLMKKKRAIVMQTPQLLELLGDNVIVSELDEDPVLLRSEKYCQIACDLRELDSFRKALESFLNLADCSVLFVAEVSVTYMDTKSADALIQWASSIGQGKQQKATFSINVAMPPRLGRLTCCANSPL